MNEDLRDDRREVIAPLLSAPKRLGRLRPDVRTTLDNILWVLRSDALWKTPSDRYGNSSTCYRRLQEWEEQGLPPRVFDAVSKWFPCQTAVTGTTARNVSTLSTWTSFPETGPRHVGA